MAVREALLGILTLGPAYGLQLHSELCERAPHRERTNVGQIYGTLDRLVVAGLVQRIGETADGLPLYALTPSGNQTAVDWLSGATLVSATDWSELLDRILISRSLDDSFLESLVGAYEVLLTRDTGEPAPTGPGHSTLLAAANARFQGAALAWLGDVRRDMSSRYKLHDGNSAGPSLAAHGYSAGRPKRGRPSVPLNK